MKCGQSRVRTYVHVSEQIYSLSPLTTRPSARVYFTCFSRAEPGFNESRRWDSNPRPADYKSAALPTELLRQKKRTSLFFGMAKVMEIFIWQNFAKIFFNDFTAFFSTTIKTGLFGPFARLIKEMKPAKLQRVLNCLREIKNHITV